MEVTLRLPFSLSEKELIASIPAESLTAVIGPRPFEASSIERAVKLAAKVLAPLAERAKSKRVAILVDDHTRPTPSAVVLGEILGVFEKSDVLVAYAKGTHDKPPQEFIERKIPREILKRYDVILHDAFYGECFYVGTTRYATPVWINREVAEAEFKIGIGSIFPAPPGFTGGCKIVLPGVAHHASINRNHFLFFSPTARAGLDAVVNFVLDLRTRSKAEVFAGDPREVLHSATPLAKHAFFHKSRAEVDVVIAAAGSSDDIDFCHATKALPNASVVCKEGGTIILVCSCPLGVQWPELSSLLEDVRRLKLRRGEIPRYAVENNVESMAAYVAYGLYDLCIQPKRRVIVVSDNLAEHDLEAFQFEVTRDLQQVLDDVIRDQEKVLAMIHAGSLHLEGVGHR